MELIAGMQSRRMDEQRASLPTLPGLTNQQELLQRLSSNNDTTALPDDNFFDMLMRCQGSRIEDQRSSLPGDNHLAVSAPTVPDDDFFSLIMRFQSSGRLEDQRSNLPSEVVRAAAVLAPRAAVYPVSGDSNSGSNSSNNSVNSAGNISTNSTSKDNLMSRLVKGRK